LDAFLREEKLVKFQIESYNDFITYRIPKILRDIGEIRPAVPELGELIIKIRDFRIHGPQIREADGSVRRILPNEARVRNLTYAAPMEVELTTILNGIESEPVWVHFGDLPVMVKSKICPLSRMAPEQLVQAGEDPDDPGGYFIINGTERLLVLVEEIAPNRIIVGKVDAGKVREIARIHSEKEGYVQRHILERAVDGTITVSFANVRRLEIVTLLRALGLESDKQILQTLSQEEIVQKEFYVNLFATDILTTKDAFLAIGKRIGVFERKKLEERVMRLLDRYLLPHLGQTPNDRMAKALFLAKACRKLIKLHLGQVEEDDLDHYANKKIRLAGDLLELQLRSILLGRWGLIARITYNYQKLAKRGRVPPLEAIVEADMLTRQLVSALAIGTWVGGRTGVGQRLERGSYVKTISHLRNVLLPLTTAQEHFKARELHPTQWGRLDPAETPEGATIGLRKHLALMAEVTRGPSPKEVERVQEFVRLNR
jgi:DNA-directed RNA polymerase beta subunit